MVKKNIEIEVQQALECVHTKQNFILTGGAGSGKTYSLVSLLGELSEKYPTKSIACITYTNNAVAEIRSRVSNDKLWVSTIHEFIWHIIKKYQVEIKETVAELINDEGAKIFKLPPEIEDDTFFNKEYFKNNKIAYDEYYLLKAEEDSRISHDHVLILAEKMFAKYPKLCDILKDTANFIFVDEYQDTDPLIKTIFLEHISQSKKECVIGFFGDAMQAIYDKGVGSINDENIIRINKVQNRRNPQSVITLANKFRDDGIEQIPSNDDEAKNMENGQIVQGNIKFVYGDELEDLDLLRNTELFQDWDFADKETKELWLVHRANARMAGFESLYELYNNDLIIDLIKKIKAKIRDGKLTIIDNENFGDIAERAKIPKGRGNLLINDADFIREYNGIYQYLKNESWEKISSYRINDDSLLAYKFNGLTDTYEAKSGRDKILRTLDNIYELIELYQNKKYNEFLRKTRFKIQNSGDKETLHNGMTNLSDFENRKIADVLNIANDLLGGYLDKSFNSFTTEQGAYLWERIKDIPFKDYVKSIEYQKEYLPFATQHSVKGSEYDNVLVVLDNMGWRNYNFDVLLTNNTEKQSIYNRSKKLFYVCITRAKKNLVVYMPTNNPNIISNVEAIFGKENVANVHDFYDF